MSVETARRVVDYFLSRPITGSEYDVSITFFGGEPFTEVELLEEIVRYARLPRANSYKRLRFSATTNATIANDRVERLIKDSGMSLLVSMDGPQHATAYRPYVSGRSSYAAVARNLPRLAVWSQDVMVRMTFHPEALDLVGNVRHVLELGAPSIALCPVLEVSWAGHEQRLQEAYDALGEWYLDEARRGRLLPLSVTNTLLYAYHRYRMHGEKPLRPCGVGTSMLGVDTEGNVMPCHRFLYRPEERLGTVHEAPRLNEKRDKYVNLTSATMLGCDDCMANKVCGGGCRAVAVMAGLGLNEPHPAHCLTMRAHARMAYHLYDTLTAENNVPFAQMLKSGGITPGPLTELAFR